MRIWLFNARDNLRLTQEEAAKRIGITRCYYTQLETGSRGNDLSAMLLMNIASALGIDLIQAMECEREYSLSRKKETA